jgi:xanthine dehydrogenase YagT iron-sulfur-binding subunit
MRTDANDTAPEGAVGLRDQDDSSAEHGNPDGQLTRRDFLTQLGAAGVAASSTPLLAAAAPAVAATAAASHHTEGSNSVPVHLNVNGEDHALELDARTTLLDCLRENLKLAGTKKGCDHGQCGACTVHVNGKRVNSCLSFAVMHDGDHITTIEGLGSPEKMHPMQAAFVENDAFQCGYCTSGQIMSAVALLQEPWGSSDTDVKHAMSGNICRCGTYPNIVAAVQQVRKHA